MESCRLGGNNICFCLTGVLQLPPRRPLWTACVHFRDTYSIDLSHLIFSVCCCSRVISLWMPYCTTIGCNGFEVTYCVVYLTSVSAAWLLRFQESGVRLFKKICLHNINNKSHRTRKNFMLILKLLKKLQKCIPKKMKWFKSSEHRIKLW